MTPEEQREFEACNPEPVKIEHFNPRAVIPHGVTIEHLCAAMNDFIAFMQMVNVRLHENGSPRFETMLMPANFSSIVGEFMTANLPKHSTGIVKNRYHNGHPDLIPAGRFPNDSVQYAHEGIEVKASRYLKSWQGHNAENIWLMVFMFDGNRAVDESNGVEPMPFRFLRVVGAQLEESDWKFAGRSETSRRTITASVTSSGYNKMMANWIYNAPGLPL
ncbi:MAG: hypothetical protein BGO61_05110 [Thiobacillus sp. 65-69]|nr:hypothetical protein [Thiobacillus sp.]ODU89768.1 MAG: hypothetical protein ABT21_08780 [Thiobacillus sp. SCN 65-179]OJW37696.1 MAG: hypothetical protein BGO61_05110 [Thiobacillus sp. 65-69]